MKYVKHFFRLLFSRQHQSVCEPYRCFRPEYGSSCQRGFQFQPSTRLLASMDNRRLEIAFGLGLLLLVANKRAVCGALLAIFYVAIFPGNINQYVNHIDAFGLNTDQARLIRLFFQPVLIFLALWTTGGWKYWKLWLKGKFKE